MLRPSSRNISTFVGSAQDRAFQYDGIGNHQKAANSLRLPAANNYTVNSLNQYTALAGLPTRTHDADGNLASGALPADQSGSSTLIWDAENRLVAVTKLDNAIIRFSYDYQSRRISKAIDGSPATRYIYDSWNMIAEYTEETLAKTYTWGTDLSGSMQGAGGVGGLLSVHEFNTQNASLTTHYPTYDGNGNVSEYLDATGATVAHYEYDSFGNTTESSGAKVGDFEHKFSTKLEDEETGFYYYGYRYYDPTTGRWPSRDPIEERGGDNLYASVFNDLVNDWDLLGMIVADSLPDPNQDCIDRGCDWKPKHNDPSKLIKNGCSNPVGKVTPNGDKDEPVKGASFKSACDNHDICYQSCGANKWRCDKLFLDEMRASCRKLKSKKEREKCLGWATLYTRAVDALGKAGHKNSWSHLQKKNCECDCDCKRERM